LAYAGFSAGFLLLLTIGGTSLWSQLRSEAAIKSDRHAQEVQNGMLRFLSIIEDAETGQRGYLLTGDERYLEPYRAAHASFEDNFQSLRKAMEDSADQQKRLADLEPVVAAKMQELQETVALRREHGFEAALKIVRTNSGKGFMDRIRKGTEEVIAVEDQLIRNRREDAAFSMKVSVLTTAVGIALIVIVSVLVLVRMNRDVIRAKQFEAELKEAKGRAEESNLAKSQFLASMSHELRTPLHGVIGMVELLCGTGLNSRQNRFADACRTSARSLLTLINDILDFSKIEAGKLVLDNHEFQLDQAVEDAVRLLGPRAREKRLELVCSIDIDACQTVRGDGTRLRQVLVNLIGNALKFTHRGEVIVQAVLQTLTAQLMTVRFQVSDTGIGIPADRVNQLFCEFSQVDSSTTRKFGGTGLGLAISKSLVEAMGGQIGVESIENAGSTFWFSSQFQRVAGSVPRVSVPSDLRGLRVLIAAKNEALKNSLVETLSSWGMTAQISSRGDEAYQRLRDAAAQGRQIDLLIVDDELPDMSSFELARITRTDQALPSTRAFLLTALEEAADDSPHVDHRVNKPVCRSELLNAITACFCPSASDMKESVKAGLVGGAAMRLSQAGKIRILLAEDNRINRMYAEELLRQAGATCESVANGIQAVEAARTAQFDLILMDCHMPDMDGFQASRKIRELERDGSIPGHIPIVALTANAVKGDRERCLDAGMDDYISKPFEQSELIRLIDRLLGGKQSVQAERPSAAGTPGHEVDAAPIDVAALFARCMGNMEFAASLLDEMQSSGADLVEGIARLVAAQDAAGAAEAAHALKGAAGIVAAEPLRSLAADIEAAGKSGDLESVASLVEGLRREMQRCLAVVPKIREQAMATPK
jgi:Amt family ammonium transporter